MTQFNMKRFGTLLKCHLLEERRNLLRMFLGFTLGLLFLHIFFTEVNGYAADEAAYLEKVEQAVTISLVVIMFGMLGCASAIFQNIRDKRPRTTFFMLPASTVEKFLVRFVWSTVVAFVIWMAAFVVADVLRMLASLLIGHEGMTSGIAMLFDFSDLSGLSEGIGYLALFVIANGLFNHAVYTLGGTIFRRQPFIVTTLLLLVLLTLVVWAWHSPSILGDVQLITLNDNIVTVHPLYYAIVAILLVLAAVCYWLAWRCFSRMPLITNKWLNV